MVDYSYLLYIPLLFITVVFCNMGKDYIEVSYYEKLREKIN